MVAIGFTVFKDKILTGEKTQTIRPYSERRWKSILKNRKLQLYWKLRTKECEFLKEVNLKEMFKIRFEIKWLKLYTLGYYTVFKEDGTWREMEEEEMEDLARRDGFESFKALVEWFREKYGVGIFMQDFMVIRW